MKPSIESAALLLAGCLLLSACSAPARKPADALRKPVTAAPLAVPAPVLAPSANGKPPADERFRNALGLMQDHRPQEAQAALQSLLKDYPDLSGPLTDAGILYAHAKQKDRALAHFERAIKANPGNVVALNWCGALYREAGDHARAEAAWQQALAVQPDYPAAELNLAILYDVSMRRPAEALVHYRRYQALIRAEDLIVAAWVRELEGRPSEVAVAGEGGR
jgi:Flp pilus assembly protein TadD